MFAASAGASAGGAAFPGFVEPADAAGGGGVDAQLPRASASKSTKAFTRRMLRHGC